MSRNWYAPPRADQFCVVKHHGFPFKGWFHTWVVQLLNKHTGELVEERRISIKLPVWGIYYAINIDEERWGELTFQYCGQRGCFFAPVFPPEMSNG